MADFPVLDPTLSGVLAAPESAPEEDDGEGGGGAPGGGGGEYGIPTISPEILELLRPGQRPARGRAGRRETLTDVLNVLGQAALGVSWEAANATERNAIRRIYNALDRASYVQQGKSYRGLSPAARQELLKGKEFSVLPSDSSQVQAAAKTELAAAVSEGEITPDEYRDALIESGLPREVATMLSDRARKNTARKSRQASEKALQVAVPKPLPAPEAPTAPRRPALSWSSLSRAIPAADLNNLTSAWMGGSLGDTAINPVRLRHLQASFPLADTPTGFLAALRSLWAAGRQVQPAARSPRLPSAPKVPTIRFRSPMR